MTIEECYRILGGDYAEVSTRLPVPKLIEKFVIKFPEDGSFEKLCAGIRDNNRAEAFLAAHTLKGVCQNLGFGTLLTSVEKLTETLRPEMSDIPENAEKLLEDVKRDHEKTVAAICLYRKALCKETKE